VQSIYDYKYPSDIEPGAITSEDDIPEPPALPRSDAYKRPVKKKLNFDTPRDHNVDPQQKLEAIVRGYKDRKLFESKKVRVLREEIMVSNTNKITH
jgi:hypothetical protein